MAGELLTTFAIITPIGHQSKQGESFWAEMSLIPHICHGRHGHVRVIFFGRCNFLQI